MLTYDNQNYFQQFTKSLSEKFDFQWNKTPRLGNVTVFDLNSQIPTQIMEFLQIRKLFFLLDKNCNIYKVV